MDARNNLVPLNSLIVVATPQYFSDELCNRTISVRKNYDGRFWSIFRRPPTFWRLSQWILQSHKNIGLVYVHIVKDLFLWIPSKIPPQLQKINQKNCLYIRHWFIKVEIMDRMRVISPTKLIISLKTHIYIAIGKQTNSNSES